jgi:hypothetical protein
MGITHNIDALFIHAAYLACQLLNLGSAIADAACSAIADAACSAVANTDTTTVTDTVAATVTDTVAATVADDFLIAAMCHVQLLVRRIKQRLGNIYTATVSQRQL